MNNSSLYFQKQASDPNYSVYVNASAGSGKTKVLIDRILRLVILGGTNLKNILCITFTNAAAEEMLERLKNKVKTWYFLDEISLVKELKELIDHDISKEIIKLARSLYGILLAESHRMKIQTMHAFCARILNISASDASDRRIISNAEKHFLLKRAYYEAMKSEALQKIVTDLSILFNNQTLFEHTVDLINQYTKFSTYLHRIDYLFLVILKTFNFEEDFDLDIFLDRELNLLKNDELFLIAKALLQSNKENAQLMEKWLTSDLEEKKRDLFEYADIFLTKEHNKRIKIVGIKALDESMQISLHAHQQKIYEIIQIKKSYVAVLHNFAFIRFAKEVFLNYEKFKDEDGLLDYDQLLINTIKLLKESDDRHWLLWKLDCEVDHILVDEAQDLNLSQWKIIQLLSEEFFSGYGAKDNNRTIFIVGDQKQSIFGFQGAEPNIFANIASYYRDKTHHAFKKWIEIDFNVSFRSGKDILSLVDRVFMKTNIISQSDVFYKNHISHRGTIAYFEIWTFDDGKKSKEKDLTVGNQWIIPEEAQNHKENIGDYIAKKILEWVATNKIITGSEKKFELSNLMIIFRKRGRIYSELCNALRKNNLPFISNGSNYLIENLIILDLLSILKFILNNDDDFNLANLLKSRFFNLKEENIFEISFNRGRKSIWQIVCEEPQYKSYYIALLEFIELFKNNSLYGFFYKIIFRYKSNDNEFQIITDEFLMALANFAQRDLLSDAFEFLNWFQAEKIKISDNDTEKNAIRITTAHAAKGLEAPIVILADAFESENVSYDNIFWTDGNLIFSSGTQYDDKLIISIKEESKKNQKMENLRLLYVAMTRARDELYVIGRDDGKSNNWYELIINAN